MVIIAACLFGPIAARDRSLRGDRLL